MMKIGAVYPQNELRGDPAALDLIGRAVERLGYDHLLMYDHVAGAVHEGRDPPLWGPYNENDPFHDPLVSFAYLAGVTRRIEFVTGVLILPQRQTLLVARQAADVDLLSGGRLRLGVGIGWNPVEYEALGEDFGTRGAKCNEQIPYLRRLWQEKVLSFDGRFDRIDRAALNPRPGRQIPIWCGGFSDAAFRRAARLADGFIFGGNWETAAMPASKRLREVLQEEGRPPEGFGMHLVLQTTRPAGRTAQEVHDVFRRWEDLGGTHASIVTMRMGLATAGEHVDYLADYQGRFGVG